MLRDPTALGDLWLGDGMTRASEPEEWQRKIEEAKKTLSFTPTEARASGAG